ncbi:MAG: ABC transporter substrate-binding protein [Microthrixaceae bacterium]|nr:ABC transporter substrate-binding protein [Microthrixaceae bacterium]
MCLVAALSVLLPATAACSDGDPDSSDGPRRQDTTAADRGGEVTYALEAETTGGWCIPESQLAISGMMVVWSVYDFLFVPSTDGFVPFLAESAESNADATEWVLTLREGVTFHDGSELDASVVKNNIDAWIGRYPKRTAILGGFALDNIDSVEIVDDLTIVITTKVPWPTLPAYLYGRRSQRHHGTGPVGRPRNLRPEPDRNRAVQVRRMGGERPPDPRAKS